MPLANAVDALGDRVLRQDTAPNHAGIDQRMASQHRARIEHRIATDFSPVADQRAEFAQAGGEDGMIDAERNEVAGELEIGNDDACGEMDLAPRIESPT